MYWEYDCFRDSYMESVVNGSYMENELQCALCIVTAYRVQICVGLTKSWSDMQLATFQWIT